MRKTAAAVLGLVTALVLPAASAHASVAVTDGGPGPFTGVVTQGQTNTHVYNNNPTNQNCIALAVNYTITLTYAPTSDQLTLALPGASATGSNGVATVTVQRGVCTQFSLTVTGTSVASAANYVVTVTRQNLPPLSLT